ncbi:heparinase II/III family protein [Methyloligella sp. 2.7D]|uniref:heparinase II/III family protein n=1 Tax=unclassified Methyloligella TaxID=2625955 RepID=UPI00157D67B3|nr:heparinase II/III family protein [Methyloligella sp. GL2]QKP76195.1 heparinase II/III family protein [Methyloligella sp. GL2]
MSLPTSYSSPSPLRRLMLASMARLRYPGSEAAQLLLAPQELRTADPSFATEIYNGHFGLAGTHAMLGSQSPFDIRPPSNAWAKALYGFDWLRHLRAAESELAHEQAKALFGDWVRLSRSATTNVAWRPDVVGRRVISWLANSVVVLDTQDARSYQTFLRTLTAELRYLSASYSNAPDGVPRLVAIMALVYAGLCIADQQAVVKRYVRPLSRELDRQILPDGGHISRNPMALVELLLDLLPLRQCFVARDRAAPEALTRAIDRAITCLRFFRNRVGELARFNGTGATPTDALASVFAYDDLEGTPLINAPHSAYGRLEREQTRIVCDLGAAPALSLSSDACAGCLSFEMDSGSIPVIVNCGSPSADHPEWREFARSTAAHSTLTLDDLSSAEFIGYGNAVSLEAEAELSGPANAKGEVIDTGDAVEMHGAHDGYRQHFGLRHSRSMVLAPTGLLVSGKDVLSPVKGDIGTDPAPVYAIRFHLHPDIRAGLEDAEGSVKLFLPNGEIWRLSSNAQMLDIAESIYFGDERGPRQSRQIVLTGETRSQGDTRIVWTLERIGEGPEEAVSTDRKPRTR